MGMSYKRAWALVEAMNAIFAAPLVEAVKGGAGALGAGAAALGSVRKTQVSKNLRDDYTALGLASISYTMLHATALGLGENATATLAQRHLEQITPLIVRISKTIPAVVLQELRDDGEAVQVSAADISAKLTHAAWQQSN